MSADLSDDRTQITDADCDSLRGEVEGFLDLALPFDEFFPVLHRQPLFRQKHYLISSKDAAPAVGPTVTEVVKVPLVLPGHSNARWVVINRTFAEARFSLNVAAEKARRYDEAAGRRTAALSRQCGKRSNSCWSKCVGRRRRMANACCCWFH
jgi:LysR family transcriptional regulator, nitrogen assimilation regulatory protein